MNRGKKIQHGFELFPVSPHFFPFDTIIMKLTKCDQQFHKDIFDRTARGDFAEIQRNNKPTGHSLDSYNYDVIRGTTIANSSRNLAFNHYSAL